MRVLAILFLIVGVALAGGAAYYAFELVERQNAANVAPEGPKTVRVVAARVPLRYGERLNYQIATEKLQFVEWPETAVPAGAFTNADELFGDDKKDSRTVVRAIEPGELLLKSKLTGFGESVRVATQLREGMRIVTIPINAVTGTAGLISPGDFVDIYFTRRNGEQLSSHVLLQKILVVATDQATDTERNRAHVAKTATVEVTPGDAQKLILALQTGTLQLLLRGVDEEVTIDDAPSLDSRSLPGSPEPEPEAKPEVKPEPEIEPFTVRVRKGGQLSEQEVEKAGEAAGKAGGKSKKFE